jgi:VIT1/CCC1 family predicted Fe2+/Mn2+ transporter
MNASSQSLAKIPLFLRGAVAIVITVTGLFLMIAGGLITYLANAQKFFPEVEGFSAALIFAGVALALKTAEKLQLAEEDPLTD